MKTDQYLHMVDSQIREAKENMEIVEQSYREAKAKYDALLSSKESYIRWVMGGKELEAR